MVIYLNHMMYGSWDMEHDKQKFLSFGPFFALVHSKKTRNQNLEKMKKTPGDIIILHMHAKNNDHMRYSFWDQMDDGQMDRLTEKVTYRGGCPT